MLTNNKKISIEIIVAIFFISLGLNKKVCQKQVDYNYDSINKKI